LFSSLPVERFLKQKYLSLWKKIDENILIFVKILLDVFQGIANSCQAPPLSSPALPQVLPFLAKKFQVWDFLTNNVSQNPGSFL